MNDHSTGNKTHYTPYIYTYMDCKSGFFLSSIKVTTITDLCQETNSLLF